MKHLISVFLIFLAFTSKVSAQTPANDAAMYKIILPAYSEYSSVKLMGVFKNGGTDTLRNVMINWTINNGPVQQLFKTDILISKNQTWPFTAPEDLVLNTACNVVVKAWVSSPNGVLDENHANDTLTQTIQVIEKYPERHVLIEEIPGYKHNHVVRPSKPMPNGRWKMFTSLELSSNGIRTNLNGRLSMQWKAKLRC